MARTVEEIMTRDPRTVENGIRRLPVVRDGALVGVVPLGDLAQDRDAGPPLAEISAASPNH